MQYTRVTRGLKPTREYHIATNSLGEIPGNKERGRTFRDPGGFKKETRCELPVTYTGLNREGTRNRKFVHIRVQTGW